MSARVRVWPFLVYLSYPLAVFVGLWFGGGLTVLGAALGAVIYPVLDEVLPDQVAGRRSPARELPFRLLQWMYVPIHYALLAFALWSYATGRLVGAEAIAAGFSFATMAGGIGFPLAHEFIHCRSRFERFLGLALLLPLFYMHFRIEHVYGHHRYVATERDPASARLGTSLFGFLPRTVVGSWLSAWRIESEQQRKRGRRAFGVHNRMCHYLLLQVGLATVVGVVLGKEALAFLIAQAAIAVFFLETVNYIEHYGLSRQRLPDGRYERVTEAHSWNTSRAVTNAMLFNLGLHSHHHTRPADRFEELTNNPEYPQLPAGYFVLIIVATIPPLWHRIMDHRAVEAAELRGKSQARKPTGSHSRPTDTKALGECRS